MTDDLVKRARDAHQDSSERTYKIPLIVEMATRIEALTADNARLRGLLSEADQRLAWESLGFGNDFADRVEAALNTGKEVIPPVPVSDTPNASDIGPGDQAVAGAAPVTVQAQIDAAGWQPIETAPKDCVIDLWSIEGGRYPDAVWDVCCGEEGWTDANDHGSLGGGSFTHWRHRPAPPPIRKIGLLTGMVLGAFVFGAAIIGQVQP